MYWSVKPDSFIINPDLNFQPFQEINSFLWEDSSSYTVYRSRNLSAIKEEYDKSYLNIRNVKKKLKEIDLRFQELEKETDALSIKHNGEVDEKFSEYDERLLEPFKKKEVKLKQELTRLEENPSNNFKNKSNLDKVIIVGKKRIELASARLKTASQASKNSQFLLSNVTMFFSNTTISAYNDISNERRSLYQKRYDLEIKRDISRVNAIEALGRDLDQIRNRVEWSDFLFFSIGISTTTTFGDLVVNDRVMKSLVSIQLLICLFIVAAFLKSAIKSNRVA